MGACAKQRDDIADIDIKTLLCDRRAGAVATAVGDAQLVALGQDPLARPDHTGVGGVAAMHKHDRLALAPDTDVEIIKFPHYVTSALTQKRSMLERLEAKCQAKG